MDRINSIPELVEDDPGRMLDIMIQRVRSVLNIQDALLKDYEEVLGEPSTP